MPRRKKADDKEIVQTFIAHSQKESSIADAARLTISETEITRRRFLEVIQRHKAVEAGKEIARQVKDEIYKDKIPLLKGIIGLSLETIHHFLADLHQDPLRKALLTISEVQGLASIASDLNGLVRLEEGKTTANIGIEANVDHNHTVTISALQKLKELDPVMEYPEMPSIETQFEYVEPE